MSRDNYNYGAGKMGNNSRQNQMIKDAAHAVGIDPDDLSDEIHRRKGDWYSGDYSYSELLEIAREIKRRKY